MVNWPESQKPRFLQGFCLCQGWCLSDWENNGKMLPNLQTFGFLVILAKFLGGVGAKHQINHTNHNIQQRQSKTKHTRPHRETHTIHNAKENSRKPNNAHLPKLPKK